MIMVSLVLKLFVSSRPLKLEGVICIYVLLSTHNAYIYDQDCVGACHLKNYFFCYHLPTWGRARVKLGDADTSPTYPKNLMLHACFHTICLVFRYTSWHFYAFSGTNLLTSRHSASSLFSVIFVFQKSYTGNILGIEWNQRESPRISSKLSENRREDGVGPRGGHTPGRRGPGPGRAPMCETASVHSWRCPFAYKDPPTGKT
jgi:hypothetical protein